MEGAGKENQVFGGEGQSFAGGEGGEPYMKVSFHMENIKVILTACVMYAEMCNLYSGILFYNPLL